MLKMESIAGKWNYRLLRGGEGVFDVIYDDGWFTRNAKTVVNGQHIRLKSKSIWQSKFNIIKNKKICGELRLQWDGGVTIKLKRSDGKGFDVFNLKRKGFFSRSYELSGKDGNVLLVFDTKFNWKTFKYNYRIREIDHHYPDEAIDELLVYSGFAVNLSAMNASSA